MTLQFDRQGLIPAVIQDAESGEVLMMAFMNAEAYRLTRETGFTHLFSRSRNAIWRKGEQSGNVQEVRGVYINCEENSLLLKVVQHGPGACHTGHYSCYYRQLLPDESYQTIAEPRFDPAQVYAQPAPSTLTAEEYQQLETYMRQLYAAYIYLRDHDMSDESNTSRLLQEPSFDYLAARLGDELQELADVQAGTHVHTGRQADTVLEASQVGYWLMLLATTSNIRYDEVKPHEAILRGYTITTPQTFEQAEECLNLIISPQRTDLIQGLTLGFTTIGRTCAEAAISPLAPAEYDIMQMRKKGLVYSPPPQPENEKENS